MRNRYAIYSTMIRAGTVTYFVDVKESTNGARYLQITEHRVHPDEKGHRSVVRVFRESIEGFRQAVNEAAASAEQ